MTKNGVAAGTTQTDGLGNYSFGNLAVGANYVVTPTGSFTPSSQTFSNLTTNATANFKAAPSIPSQCSTASFAAANNFAVGDPRSVAVGDFNGDGKVDLAIPNQVANNVAILLGTGNGSFSAATNFAAGSGPRFVAVGDFNGDGKLDLAVANNGSNDVSILLGTGAGGFSSPTNFAVGANPFSVAVGDINGDSKLDLVTANTGSDNLSVLMGTGTGSFSAASNFSVGSQPDSVAVADLNRDGKLDLVVANFNSGDVSILLGAGNGNFAAANNFAVSPGAFSVAVGDFNGDAALDVVTANFNPNNVSILLGTGTGGFGVASNLALGLQTRSLAIGDFNGDGKLDLAVANSNANNVSILLGTGTGIFTVSGAFSVGTQPDFVAMGEFNGDGKPDLAVANLNSGNVSILLNNGTACNTQTSLTISGKLTDARNNPLPDVAVTLTGPISRVTSTDASGNYSFANLAPGGNYAVTVQTPYFVVSPTRADFFNLSSSQIANFVAAPVAVPSPTPPLADDFTSATRDATKWTIGTQTEPPNAFDPQVTTAQVNGQLVITPLTQASGMHYNGYVAANSFDMRGARREWSWSRRPRVARIRSLPSALTQTISSASWCIRPGGRPAWRQRLREGMGLKGRWTRRWRS